MSRSFTNADLVTLPTLDAPTAIAIIADRLIQTAARRLAAKRGGRVHEG